MAELPSTLADLAFLAHNLRWSWHAETRGLFEHLDPALWQAARHNPVLMLERLDPISLQIAANDPAYLERVQRTTANLRAYLGAQDTWYAQQGQAQAQIAYFSAEFAITEALPIFSGGLGVLAGDHLKSASDLGVPLVGVTLLYREGYFNQRIDRDGWQHEGYESIDPRRLPIVQERTAEGAPLLVTVPMLDHQAYAAVWRADVGRVRLFLLDTDVPENKPVDRHITDRLYGGDNEHRLRQEIVLGIGGLRALHALGIQPDVIHLNEGHAAFAAVEHIRLAVRDEGGGGAFFNASRKLSQHCVFTTHTPVPAGHDMFAAHLMERYLGGYVWEMREPWRRFLALGRHDATDDDEPFNMTLLALRLSGRRNGVSKLHGEVSRKMWHGVWPGISEEEAPIRSITNGVHLPTWVSPTMSAVYARYISADWADAETNGNWAGALEIPARVIWEARNEQRERFVRHVRQVLTHQLARRGEDPRLAEPMLGVDRLTIIFARRFATYKRANLLLTDRDRLSRLLRERDIQFVFAGKAHPKDEPGKELLRHIYEFGVESGLRDRFVFVEEYDVALARSLVSGADVWLNVPRRPYEASGTSGMKAAANGALNLSIPDGWWAEAWDDHNQLAEPIGWSIAAPQVGEGQDAADADALYTLLEGKVVPLFFERDEYGVPVAWCERVKASIRQVVPYFNTHRMVREYVAETYLPARRAALNGLVLSRT